LKSLCASVALVLMTSAFGSTVAAQSPDPAAPQTGLQVTAPTFVRLDGRLTTSTGEPRAGPALMVVSLYADKLDSTPLWTEQQFITLDPAGRYTIFAGATQTDGLPKALFVSNSAHWLGVGVQGESEQPRVMLLSMPYALKAADADTLAGKTVTDFVLTERLSDSVKSVLNAGEITSDTRAGTSGTGPGTRAPVAANGVTISNQETFAAGTETAPAVIFDGPPSAETGSYAFSFVPAEAVAATFSLTGASYPNSGDTRTNQVFRLGANVSPNCLQHNSDAAIYDSWESHYAPNTTRNVERHISFSPSNCTTETRLWSANVDKLTGIADVSSTSDRWLWYTRADGSVYMDINPHGQSLFRGSLDVGTSTAGASGNTLSVFNQAGNTSVVIKAGAAQGGNLFTVARNNSTPAFYVNQDFDVYATGYVSTAGLAAVGDSFSSNWITNGYAASVRNDGSVNLRNSSGSSAIRFSSGTHEYDASDVSIVRGAAGLIAITNGSAGVGGSSTYRDLQIRAINPTSGNVGIGTTSPGNQLDIWSGTSNLLMVRNGASTAGWNAGNSVLYVSQDSTTSRSINAAGSINVAGADYAEWFGTNGDVAAGDVVAISTDGKAVKAAAGVIAIGVVSTRPGFIGNDGAALINPEPVAFIGQVPVKISEEHGRVHAGDRLAVSKALTGYAAKMTESGQSIGVALADSTSETGNVLAFVNLSYEQMDISSSADGTKITVAKDVDLQARSLLSVKAIASASGKWNIDEEGLLTVSGIKTDLGEFRPLKSPPGLTILDRATGQPVCVYSENNVLKTTPGDCDSVGSDTSRGSSLHTTVRREEVQP
jgi:hypothetical protein